MCQTLDAGHWRQRLRSRAWRLPERQAVKGLKGSREMFAKLCRLHQDTDIPWLSCLSVLKRTPLENLDICRYNIYIYI